MGPAMRAVRVLPFFLNSQGCATLLRQGQVEAALLLAFEKTEKDLERHAKKGKVMLAVSGCTAVCALWHATKNCIWVATAGDSRAALVVPGMGVAEVTQDHDPSVEAERRRVEENGGEVLDEEFDDGEIVQRVFVRGEEYPGLAMTRCLGDTVVKGCGVI